MQDKINLSVSAEKGGGEGREQQEPISTRTGYPTSAKYGNVISGRVTLLRVTLYR